MGFCQLAWPTLATVCYKYLGLTTNVVLILTAQLVAEQGNELVTLGVGETGHHELGSHERGVGVRHLVGCHGIVQRGVTLAAALLLRRGFGGYWCNQFLTLYLYI